MLGVPIHELVREDDDESAVDDRDKKNECRC